MNSTLDSINSNPPIEQPSNDLYVPSQMFRGNIFYWYRLVLTPTGKNVILNCKNTKFNTIEHCRCFINKQQHSDKR